MEATDVGQRTKIQPVLTWRGAICESDLSPTARHVALTLSLWMGERGDSAYPGATLLSESTGLSVRTVRSSLAALVDAGWLVMVEKGGLKGVKRIANKYEARIPDPRLPMQEVHPCSSFTGESDDADPCNSQPRPVQEVHPNSPGTLQELSSGFDEFWKLWPSKLGRTEAVTAWNKATKKVHPDIIIAGLNNALPEFATRDPKYIPRASTWLNKERWTDEYAPAQPEPEQKPELVRPVYDDADTIKARDEAAAREASGFKGVRPGARPEQTVEAL